MGGREGGEKNKGLEQQTVRHREKSSRTLLPGV